MPIHDWSRVYSGMFHDFHQSWSIRIKDSLNGGLLPKGVTALVESKAGNFESDVLAVGGWSGPAGISPKGSGGPALLERPATKVVSMSDSHFYAAKANRIVVQKPLGRTIAVIEIVSPGNKDGKRAIKQFVEKSQAFLSRNIHLLVVDLFAPTKRDPRGIHQEIWSGFDDDDELYSFPPGKDRTAVSYEVGQERKAAYVEPFALGDDLPDMPLFLAEGYAVPVPLEAAYRTTWSFLPDPLREIVETGVMPTIPDGE